ncbi:YfhO family protein [Candidatus Curtissbacteria bacterium]|nr:YfhO family protein [Candidatus Curtissbacteria bacterium]
MVKNKEIKERKLLVALFIICLSFFAPFLIKPELLTTKDNDLGRTYIPIANFIHKSFADYKQFPLWRSDQMMGETFIANPVSSIIYPANFLFFSNNINLAIIIYLLIHFEVAAISTYFLAKSFNLSLLSSFGAAIFYAFSIKMFFHLSAGHLTMIAAFSYFPLLFLSVRKVLFKQKFGWQAVGAISLAFIYATYPTIFFYSVVFIILYFIYFCLSIKKITLDQTTALISMFIITFCLSAIVILPQLEFAPLSTRSTLKIEDVALPLWNFRRFLTSIFLPYLDFNSFDHESFLYLGLVPIFLSIYTFLKLPKFKKLFLLSIGFLTLLFIVGLSTPFFELTYKLVPFLKYSRITTRLWFVVALVTAILAAFALERIKNQKFKLLIIVFFIFESCFIAIRKINSVPSLTFANEELYRYLLQDNDIFRVYCTTYCFNPQQISKFKIHLLNGETPIQDAKFIKFLEIAGNYNYSDFAVIFPPYQIWQQENPPIPYSKLLGQANVKYVASTYQIISSEFDFIDKFDNIYLYKNKNYQKRVYFKLSSDSAQIEKYYPNNVIIKVERSSSTREMIFSENYFPGWYAYFDHQKYEVEPADYNFRKIIIPPNTEMVELKYQPQSLAAGKTITFASVISLLIIYIHIRKRKNG